MIARRGWPSMLGRTRRLGPGRTGGSESSSGSIPRRCGCGCRRQRWTAAELGQVTVVEGSVEHVEVFQMAGVGTSIFERPRPLSRYRRADVRGPPATPWIVKSLFCWERAEEMSGQTAIESSVETRGKFHASLTDLCVTWPAEIFRPAASAGSRSRASLTPRFARASA